MLLRLVNATNFNLFIGSSNNTCTDLSPIVNNSAYHYHLCSAEQHMDVVFFSKKKIYFHITK